MTYFGYERMFDLAHGSPSPHAGRPIKEGFQRHVYVYAICLNEAHNVDCFLSWASEADGMYCLDTGSTDGTQDLLRRHGVEVENRVVDPWRFDEAKNRGMALVPDDAEICVCFNLDEAMFPRTGWRRQLEILWSPWVSQARYKYIASLAPDGGAGATFWFAAIHSRHEYIWRYPTHEVLWGIQGKFGETITTSLECHHARPSWKPKSDDLSLLKLALAEAPDDHRCLHYYGRELYFHRRWQEADFCLRKHMEVSSWGKEKAASAKMLAICAGHLQRPWEVEQWYLRAVSEAPEMREHWMSLGRYYLKQKKYLAGYYCAKQALEINYRDMWHYHCSETDWHAGPWELLSICAWHTGLQSESREAIRKAVDLAPGNARVKSNYQIIMGEQHRLRGLDSEAIAKPDMENHGG
jgi:hypothetical protein